MQDTGEAQSHSFPGITGLLSFLLHDHISKSLKALGFEQLKHHILYLEKFHMPSEQKFHGRSFCTKHTCIFVNIIT